MNIYIRILNFNCNIYISSGGFLLIRVDISRVFLNGILPIVRLSHYTRAARVRRAGSTEKLYRAVKRLYMTNIRVLIDQSLRWNYFRFHTEMRFIEQTLIRASREIDGYKLCTPRVCGHDARIPAVSCICARIFLIPCGNLVSKHWEKLIYHAQMWRRALRDTVIHWSTVHAVEVLREFVWPARNSCF